MSTSGFQVERVDFNAQVNASNEVLAFQRENGDQFINLLLTGAFARDSRNSRLLPSEGSLTRLSTEVAVPGSDLSYYKVRLRHQQFFPLTENFIVLLNGEVGYGAGLADTRELPLTDNFFAGGIRSVRGYEANTLGPRDSRGDPLGGNLLATGNAELILPLPFLEDARQVRVTTFLDAGNVFGPNENFRARRFSYFSWGVGDLALPVGGLDV